MDVRAGVWEDTDAPPKRRPSVQVEGQLMELRWLAADSRHLVGCWDGSQVVDPQEVSRLTRQEQLNTSVKPRPLCFRPLLELYPACHTDGPSPAAASQVRDKLLQDHLDRDLVDQQMETKMGVIRAQGALLA